MAESARTTLVFLETGAQCTDYLAGRGTHTADRRIIALSPEAMEALDAVSVPYKIPEDYALEELVEIGDANFEETKAFCERLDHYLQESISVVGQRSLTPATYRYYSLKVLRDAVTLRLQALHNIFDSEEPSEAVCFGTAPTAPRADPSFVSESLYAHLVPLVAAKRLVPCTMRRAEPMAPTSEPRVPLVKRLARWALGPALYETASVLRSIGLRSVIHLWRRAPTHTVLVVRTGPDLGPILRECVKQERFRFIHWNGTGRAAVLFPFSPGSLRHRVGRPGGRELEAACHSSWEVLAREPWMRDFFTWDGTDAFPTVASRLEEFVVSMVPEIVGAHEATKEVIRRYTPALVLLSVATGHVQRAVLDAAQREGVPVVGYQHGGTYGYLRFPMHYYNDLAVVDEFGSYGVGVKEFFEEQYAGHDRRAAAVTAIGSQALKRLKPTRGEDRRKAAARLGLDPSRRTVVYAPTGLAGNLSYLPGSYPDGTCYRAQTQLLDLMAKHPEVDFVVKVPARNWARNPIGDRISRLGLKHVKLLAEQPFASVLEAADDVIIDWPSGTLLQALRMGTPVVVLADRRVLELDAGAESVLRRAVRLASDPEGFITEVEGMLGGAPTLTVEESAARAEFLRLYGTGPDDLDTLEAALIWLDGVAAGGLPRELDAPVGEAVGR